ncbi:hypothetical protein KO361_05400 [Candidatus Woesearchaeota archaeon]|nr:hypothetical protein [Candidatus Woesearchaeota archaeon]
MKKKTEEKSDKPLTVVFCLPGNNFSGQFLDRWSELLLHCVNKGIRFYVSRQESCNIYYVRNMCLGGNVLRGENQKPFNEELDYDYLMWIDSDSVFTPQQFDKLLEHDKDIVSGVYMMSNGIEYATVKEWDEEFFKKNGYFTFLKPEDCKDLKEGELLDVAYTGFGFILIKKGVFESLTYPWFRQEKFVIGDFVDYSMEDVSFCMTIRKKGYKIWVDPSIRVGHEKKVIL